MFQIGLTLYLSDTKDEVFEETLCHDVVQGCPRVAMILLRFPSYLKPSKPFLGFITSHQHSYTSKKPYPPFPW